MGGGRIDFAAGGIITMMRCAETIGPKSNMEHGFEPQELSDRFRQASAALSAGQVSFVVGLNRSPLWD
jgi:hypothetical protein